MIYWSANLLSHVETVGVSCIKSAFYIMNPFGEAGTCTAHFPAGGRLDGFYVEDVSF